MLAAFPAILAAHWTDLLLYGIVGAFMVGGWIIDHVRKKAAQREAEQRGAQQQLESGRRGIAGAADAAEARRRELTETAARRRGDFAAGPPAQAQPGNLTLEQLRQRALAKIEYERRAAALRAQQQAQQQDQAGALAEAAARAQAEAQRTQAERAARAERARQRQAALARRQAELQRRARMDAPDAAPATPAQAVPQAVPVAQPVAEPLPEALSAAAARMPAPAVARVALGKLHLTPQSLREAIVMREVLGPPVALRAGDAW